MEFISYNIQLQSSQMSDFKFIPAVNSVPASSAVSKKSSRLLCSVTERRLILFQSYPSSSSLVWSWNIQVKQQQRVIYMASTFCLHRAEEEDKQEVSCGTSWFNAIFQEPPPPPSSRKGALRTEYRLNAPFWDKQGGGGFSWKGALTWIPHKSFMIEFWQRVKFEILTFLISLFF